MDYITGKNLESLLQEQPTRRFSLPFVIRIMAPIVDAINYLHTQNPPIIHRDIKPPNIIVPLHSADALLVDFGLAKEDENDKTTNVFRYGTPGYAAPEQYGQGTDIRTDVYGLAATIYTLLTGIVPSDALTRSINNPTVTGDTLKCIHQMSEEIPPVVSKVIVRAMALRKEDRFDSIEAFWQAFCTAAQHPEIEFATFPHPITNPPVKIERPVLPEQKLQPTRKRRTRQIIIGGLVVLAVILVAGILDLVLPAAHPARTAHSLPAPAPTTISSTTVAGNTACSPTSLLPGSDYPQFSACYGGTINDIGIPNRDKTLYLTAIQQNQGQLKGHFQGLGLSGLFQGSIDKSGNMHFVVKFPSQSYMLDFTGTIKIGGDLRGDFSTKDQQGNPIPSDYGNWAAQKVTSTQ